MSTELRRLYEMWGGLECDALCEREGNRMIAASWAAEVPALQMNVDTSIHAIRVTMFDRTGDLIPIRAIGDERECARRNDQAVADFIARVKR